MTLTGLQALQVVSGVCTRDTDGHLRKNRVGMQGNFGRTERTDTHDSVEC